MCSSKRLGLARRLLALSVSLAVVLSSYAFTIATAKTSANSGARTPSQANSGTSELQLTSATATATKAGVLLYWTTNAVADNLGFNVYRLKDGQRTRANKEIIPGSLFGPGPPALMRAGYSYSWFDRGGSADSTYYIESVKVDGATKMHSAVNPIVSKGPSEFDQIPETLTPNTTESTNSFEKRYPTEELHQADFGSNAIEDQWAIVAQTALKIDIIKDGWYRVTQPQMVAAGFNPTVDIRNLRLFVAANEVAINTSQQTGPFGSSDYIEFYGRGLDVPTTNKRTYYLIAGTTPGKRVGGDNQVDGGPTPTPTPPFPVPSPTPVSTPPLPVPSPTPVSTPPSPDRLPTPAPSSTPPSPVRTPTPAPQPVVPLASESPRPLLSDPIFFSWAQNDISMLLKPLEPSNADRRDARRAEPATAVYASPVDAKNNAPADYSRADSQISSRVDLVPDRAPQRMTKAARGNTDNANASANSASGASPKLALPSPQPAIKAGSKSGRRARARKRNKRIVKRQRKQEHSHASVAVVQLSNFDYTVQIKDRGIYFSSLLNGDEENWFGAVIVSPVNQTLVVSNPDLTAGRTATLEVALQGTLGQGLDHDINVSVNGLTVGSIHFQPLDHPVRSYSIPISQILSGNNTINFTKTSSGDGACIVDYIKLTYPHTFNADSNSLKFNVRGTQTVKVDTFSTPSIRLIDYTDPLNVSITRPVSEASPSGYAITVARGESLSKAQRLLYAIPQGQFDQPAALTLNQASTLNANSNAGAFLIISHKDFIQSFTANVSPINTSLVAQRQSQGLTVVVADIDDVYDEFGFGIHGPQAIRDFIQHAATHWVTPPRYVVFAGDASHDPRSYEGIGNFDFVPTKLVDATYNETSSDNWFTDFDDDGVENIPVGRIPVRTLAEANLVVSKIVNFTPPQPQTALLVADEDAFNIFGFAQTNDVFQSLLPAGMTVLRLNRAPQPSGVPSQVLVKADIVNAFNAGPALAGYSGHGNIDVWTGGALFTSTDAMALTNGNRLPFVVVMDCLNGYFQDPRVLSLSEGWLKAPNGGAVAAFASSGLTIAQGQHEMGQELYTQLYSGSPVALGDAIKIARGATFDIDVKRTWIFFGDPSLKIR